VDSVEHELWASGDHQRPLNLLVELQGLQLRDTLVVKQCRLIHPTRSVGVQLPQLLVLSELFNSILADLARVRRNVFDCPDLRLVHAEVVLAIPAHLGGVVFGSWAMN